MVVDHLASLIKYILIQVEFKQRSLALNAVFHDYAYHVNDNIALNFECAKSCTFTLKHMNFQVLRMRVT